MNNLSQSAEQLNGNVRISAGGSLLVVFANLLRALKLWHCTSVKAVAWVLSRCMSVQAVAVVIAQQELRKKVVRVFIVSICRSSSAHQ